MTEPYREAAWTYWRAGWRGVLPLPPGRKTPPPGGYTGWAGVEPSGADVQAWIEGEQGAGNICLHLPAGVYGLDVDDYGGKTGASALERLVEQFGPLPSTWTVSSREASASGIRLFLADHGLGRVWVDEPAGHGAGIEAIHRGHRYAVVWPSVHPDTGRKYAWRRPDGIEAAEGEVPEIRQLPHLPAAWIEGLSKLGEVRIGETAGHAEAVDAVTGWREGEPCPRTRKAAERALGGLSAAAAGAALHPAATAALHELCCLGHEGHVGVRRALAEHFAMFVEVRDVRTAVTGDGSRRAAEGEWWRMVRGAVGKLIAANRRDVCDCDAMSGAGLLWDPYSGPDALPAPLASTLASDANGITLDGPGDLADVLILRMIGPAELRDRPAPPWLIDGLLSLDSSSWLIAAPASYKSFVALDWAAHVGLGRPWLGRTVVRGGVLYVVAEGVAGMGPRIRAWEQRYGPMADDVRFLPMPVQIGKADHWAALVEATRRLGPALVILDTQARITVGLDENDNTAMGEVVDAIERLRKAAGSCVLVVHHLGRTGQHARGASAIDGAQDTELRLTRTADFRAVLQVDKSKNAADDVRVELELFKIELDQGGSSLVVGEPLMGAAALAPDWRANLPINQATLLDTMLDIFPARGATKAELKAEVRKRPRQGFSGEALDPMNDSSFRRAWDALVDGERFVRIDGTQRYVIDSPIGGDQNGLA